MSTKGVLAHSPKAHLDKKKSFHCTMERNSTKINRPECCANLHLMKRTIGNARVTENLIKNAIF